MLIKLLYTVVLGAVILSSCTSTDNRTVRDVMDETITELYKTKTEDQLLSLSNDQVISLFE
jgi:hypothetical protein